MEGKYGICMPGKYAICTSIPIVCTVSSMHGKYAICKGVPYVCPVGTSYVRVYVKYAR